MDADEIARQERIRQKREAYLNVFGKEGERTVHQLLVLEDLMRFTQFGDTAIVKDDTGRYDGGLTAYKAGLQDVMKRINLRLTWRPNEHSSSDSEPTG